MILFIGYDASLTGASKSLLLIIEYFTKRSKIPIYIILGKGGPLIEDYNRLGKVEIWEHDWYFEKNILKRINNRLFNTNKKRQKNIIKKLQKSTPKIIFNNTIGNGDILKNLSILNVKIISRVPEMETVINLYNTNFKNSSDKVFKYSDQFISPSNSAKDVLLNNYDINENKVQVCYGTINEKLPTREDLSLLKKQLNINDHAFIVGACGTLGWRKGSDLFLRVANKLKNEKDIFFLWVGADTHSSNYHQFVYEAKKYEILKNLIIIPKTKEVHKYFQLMNVFLMTSREDPFPLVNLEAAINKVPIICFENSGGSSEFVDETSGFVVPFCETQKMADIVIELKKTPKKLLELSNGIFEKSKKFNNKNALEKIFDIVMAN